MSEHQGETDDHREIDDRRRESLVETHPAPIIVAGAGVRDFVARNGGRLYVWTIDHRCCTGQLTLLRADVTRPPGWRSTRPPLDETGFELHFDSGAHGQPRELVLELSRRGRAVRAFWNGCAYVMPA